MAAHMGDFAKNHMKRHGWKSGNGLGRNEDGISEAIKVKIKRGNAGVGHDAAEQFTFHWWDHVFNKAASNITVKHNENGVEVLKKEKESSIISNEKPVKAKGKKDALYSMFVKSATLTTEGEKPVEVSSSSSEDEVEEKIDFTSGLADDELFKACGGRTAHKGARHGLKANGKLQRLEEQERLLKIEEEKKEELCKIKDNDAKERKKKKKKKSKNSEVTNDLTDVNNEKKKRTKIGTEQMEEENISLNEEENIADENVEKKDRKRKKKKNIEEYRDEELDNFEHIEKKSKKIKSKESESTSKNEDETLSEDIDAVPKKRKKKKKRKNHFEDE